MGQLYPFHNFITGSAFAHHYSGGITKHSRLRSTRGKTEVGTLIRHLTFKNKRLQVFLRESTNIVF
ncbi:Hypothetical predicted protein [Podarcis lilfordi]|uniref:Uncharacterized protein n=1 Tax=Podarcis lilfordi TaxID=74358 RepID=A0AA35P543_9SAUR|nr:Hypothetical predicted protein [Podarcis lilfordi]